MYGSTTFGGQVTSYTFSNISNNHTLNVVFETIPSFTITATSGEGGSITPDGTVRVNGGTNQSFNIRPNTGYRISNVRADGVSVGAVTSYTFSNINSNHTISASFAILTYTITGSAGSNGSITPPAPIV